MIQQIYITDYLSDAAAQPAEMIQSLIEQCPILLKGQWQVNPLPPLKTLWHQLGIENADVAAILCARRSWPSARPAFCLLPVHLGLRRDTFSLQSVVPLTADEYAALTERLKNHFSDDLVVHTDESQRYWWIQPLRDIDAYARWPQDCLYQQAFQWQPQGADASVIRQWTNEMQMLLHDMAYAPAGGHGPDALNSLWFASVGDLPQSPSSAAIIGGQGAIFSGLLASQLPGVQSNSMATMWADKKITNAIWVADQWQSVDWADIADAIQTGQVSELNVVLPFAERSVHIQYKKQFRWQFWRKAYTLETLLQQLETTLSAIR